MPPGFYMESPEKYNILTGLWETILPHCNITISEHSPSPCSFCLKLPNSYPMERVMRSSVWFSTQCPVWSLSYILFSGFCDNPQLLSVPAWAKIPTHHLQHQGLWVYTKLKVLLLAVPQPPEKLEHKNGYSSEGTLHTCPWSVWPHYVIFLLRLFLPSLMNFWTLASNGKKLATTTTKKKPYSNWSF